MPDDAAAVVAATHDVALLSRWLDLVATGADDDVTRAIRGAASH